MVAIDRVEELGGMAEIVEKRAMYSVKLCLPERDGFNTPGSVATPRATRDARLARRFATVFGRLVRGSLPKSCLIDPLQTSPGGHPAKTGTA
ncbi:hypothetical protein [Pseudomonas aeruginosa]|uniref:hypothetical protein n=1 Tax=Pseudomonas aeruginosa TaxID=287 RepID=UPI0022EB6709|nr:hypothetical protein [Pseudomonas aeruginosa]MDA3366474.1 hypothetical protein [Pseudomonas aeruginosa]